MSLEPNEKLWVDRLATQAKVRAALDKRREQKDAVLERMAGEIERVRAEILQKIQGLTASDGKTAMQVLDYMTRDQTTEFDLADQMNGFGFGEDAQKKLSEIGLAFDLLAKDLNTKTKAIDPKTGDELDTEEPLFSVDDLKKGLYQPIVRQGMMSDTFVEDRYSDTAELLKGSFEAYKGRLDEEGLKSAARENFDLGLVVVKGVTTVVSNSLGLKGLDKDPSTWAPSLEFVDDLTEGKPDAIAEVCSTGLELISMGIEGYDTVGEVTDGRREELLSEEGAPSEEDPGGEKKAQARRAAQAPKTATQLVAAVASALGQGWKGAGWDLGVSASSAYGSSVQAGSLARQLATNPLQAAQVTQLRDLLKAGFAAALSACDPGSAAAGDLPASAEVLRGAGQKMATKFEAAFAVDRMLKLLKEEKFGDAAQLAATAATQAVTEGKTADKLDELLGDPDREKAAKAAAGQKLTEDFQREMDDDEIAQKKQEAELTNAAEGEKKAGLLAARIRQMEESERVVKWAASIAGLGLDVASKFIGPLAVAGAALTLAQDVVKAAKRTRDWYNFYESKLDMFQAASAYSAPVANFHYNARKQAIHYQINAALDFVNMVGAVCECVGAASFGAGVIAGKIVQGAASIAGALEAVIYEVDKRVGLEKAWEVYRVALANPENRRLGLIALKENPSLAKYAVAWGAIVKKDPLVGDFLDRCNMTAEELEDPKSRVGDVVKYLELRMPDDNVVVGREVAKSGWQPADTAILLTASSWISARKLAEANAGLAVQATRDIEVAFIAFASAQTGLVVGTSPKPDWEKARDLLKEAVVALNAYRPKRKDSSVEHTETRVLVDKFRQKAGLRQREIEEEIAKL